MDILRASIESAFYDLSLNGVAEAIIAGDDGTILYQLIKESIKWENPNFTISEIGILDSTLDKWLRVCNHCGKFNRFQRILYLLYEFSSQVLICDGIEEPRVSFKNLLRWRESSVKVSEESLVIPFLAKKDLDREKRRTNFCWSNILDHDNFRLNAILDRELSDTHSHVYAAMDVFEFNWLALMNGAATIEQPNRKKESRFSSGMRMEYDHATRLSKSVNLYLTDWMLIGSAIRILLFGTLRSGKSNIKRATILDAFTNRNSLIDLQKEISQITNIYRETALSATNGLKLDYAIQIDEVDTISSSPFMVHYGERYLLYRWFHGYFANVERIWETADLMFLYLLIRIKVRREFIQTNKLSGFENFQIYQKIKGLFLPKQNEYWDIVFRYAVQSSIRSQLNQNLEARVTPGKVAVTKNVDFRKSIFGNGDFLSKESNSNVSIVAHYIKEEDKGAVDGLTPRHNILRLKLLQHTRELIDIHHLQTSGDNKIPLVGIDAASSELACRPEIFAPYFRMARFHGLRNFTFHAGEDFYDIIDGLRSVDETLKFLDYRSGDRIGHGLALGTLPADFYQERHFTIIIPRQLLLDNLVWLKFFAARNNVSLSPQTLDLIEEKFSELTAILEYPHRDSMAIYWESMNLRGDYMDKTSIVSESDIPTNEYILYSPVSQGKNASKNARELRIHYELNAECRQKGADAEIIKFEPSIIADVAAVQEKLLEKLEREYIVIETNPSSNLKIGRFHRYDKHPVFRFHDISGDAPKHSMVVSINTDDKGVFSTSLRNEYSLIAIALTKMLDNKGERVWSDLQIENYISRIANYGNISRFR